MTKKKFEIILDILMILSGLAGAIGASVTHTKPIALLILGGLVIALFGVFALVVDLRYFTDPMLRYATMLYCLENCVQKHCATDAERYKILFVLGDTLKYDIADKYRPTKKTDIMDFIHQNDTEIEAAAANNPKTPIRKVVL